MEILLSNLPWVTKGFWPYIPLLGRSIETGLVLEGVTDWIPASVPGCVHNDLLLAGLIDDPYYDLNSIKCEWVENRWWTYRTEFEIDSSYKDYSIELVFKGIDYKCHIFINGEKLCEHEGAFEPIKIDIKNKISFDMKNELEVILESMPKEMGQIGYTSKVFTQRSRFGYKWDFSTRLVHAGIWDDVYLKLTSGGSIENVHVVSDMSEQKGIVKTRVKVKAEPGIACVLKASLYDDGKMICSKSVHFKGSERKIANNFLLEIENPKLWWPNGYGGQPLYTLKIEIFANEKLSDEYNCEIGIRKLEYERNDDSQDDALPYTVKINGKRIYIKGVNLVPLDHMIGAISEKRYIDTICTIREANINLVRVWGGGIIEKDIFYRLCDKNGILVWQDFIQSSSGIDNAPSEDKRFMMLLKRNSIAAIKGKRNYTCLTFWTGGNELRGEDGNPATYHNANIKMLHKLIKRYDPLRMFFPSTASGPNEFLENSLGEKGRNHDVHGPWKYEGIEKQYELFNHSDSLLHSEFGVDGFTNKNAIKKFMSSNNMGVFTIKSNPIWRHHGEWWDTTDRDREIFGDIENLDAIIKCSQFIQAEGLRYVIEANRRRKFNNSGSIIWQMNEPWPNLFCTCLIDYYLEPKMVYYWVKKAYAPICASLSYSKLKYQQGEEFIGSIYLHNSMDKMDCEVIYRILDLSGNIRKTKMIPAESTENSVMLLKTLKFEIGNFIHGIFFVEIITRHSEFSTDNLYMFTTNEKPVFAPLLKHRTGNTIRLCILEENPNEVVLKNIGDIAVLFVKVSSKDNKAKFHDNFFTIFPGQERKVGYISDRVYSDNEFELDWMNL